ncbi:hypothetical protein V6N12_069082 [Hibiscus sabdariffa]|uniref:Uncharacterized protein n=1 Tax=Hibiscus sabdariffa TaxID=183260 RepID=A0ABR2FCU2_9ROSI
MGIKFLLPAICVCTSITTWVLTESSDGLARITLKRQPLDLKRLNVARITQVGIDGNVNDQEADVIYIKNYLGNVFTIEKGI